MVSKALLFKLRSESLNLGVKVGEKCNGECLKLYVLLSHSFVKSGDNRLRNKPEVKITGTKLG